MVAMYEIWQRRRAEQQEAADMFADQIRHGHTGENRVAELLVATWRRSWAERISEAESEGEPLPVRESFDTYVAKLLAVFRFRIPHGFNGANGWGPCAECGELLEAPQHETEAI